MHRLVNHEVDQLSDDQRMSRTINQAQLEELVWVGPGENLLECVETALH